MRDVHTKSQDTVIKEILKRQRISGSLTRRINITKMDPKYYTVSIVFYEMTFFTKKMKNYKNDIKIKD